MSIAELAASCDERGGVLATTLGDLRDAVDAGKLGRLVMERIAQELAANGLGYFPREVLDSNDQPRQWEPVRVYRKGAGALARAIEAVLDPSPRGDAFLVELGSSDAQDKLRRIREIVATDGG
jgi:hypothetical protein